MAADEALAAALRRHPASSAQDLAARLGVSVPTVHRLLRSAAAQVVTLGRARRTRHAWRRALPGQPANAPGDLPIYQIGADGMPQPWAPLALLTPEGTALPLEGTGWPVPEEARDGWWPGLPYPLQDMRPQGYMGRQFARAVHEALQLPADPRAWSDDNVLLALARTGNDTVGNLIVGDEALRRWQSARLDAPAPLAEADVPAAYLALADQAVAGGGAGSSAAGEFPKFAALRTVADNVDSPGFAQRTPHVLVKFSGAGDTLAERRWADLLLTEHLALTICMAQLGSQGVAAARSRWLQAGGRAFLEVERFDRHGRWGRSPLVSLESVNAAFLGRPHLTWPELVAELARGGWLADGAQHAAQVLWWFGRLIGNTDMHLGNLSFRPHNGQLALAPAYDMLPMRYAPLSGGEAPPLALLEPVLPLPGERTQWLPAASAALLLWQSLAQDRRATIPWRTQAQANADRLNQAIGLVDV
jgi:hypothetical protein